MIVMIALAIAFATWPQSAACIPSDGGQHEVGSVLSVTQEIQAIVDRLNGAIGMTAYVTSP